MHYPPPSPADPLPPVSVVIPHFGPHGQTLTLLADLVAQDYVGELQLIVVDDASPEPFPAGPHSPYELVRNSRNRGFGSTVNAGCARARGELLVILNSDVRCAPDAIDRLVRGSRRHPGAICGPAIDSGDGPAPTARRFPGPLWQFMLHTRVVDLVRHVEALARFRFMDGRATLAADFDRADWVSGAALVIPRVVFEELGGFDPEYYMYYEDVDLQRRAHARGIPIVALHDAVVTHVGRGSTPTEQPGWGAHGLWTYATHTGARGRMLLAFGLSLGANLGYNTVRYLVHRRTHPLRDARLELKDLVALARHRDPRHHPHPDKDGHE